MNPFFPISFQAVMSSSWCSRISSLGKPSPSKALFEPGEVLRARGTQPFVDARDTKFRVKLQQASHCHLRAVKVTGEPIARRHNTHCREPNWLLAPRTLRP